MESDRDAIATASQLSAAHTAARAARDAASRRFLKAVVVLGFGSVAMSFASTGIGAGLLPARIAGDDAPVGVVVAHFLVSTIATVLTVALLAAATLLMSAREATDAHTAATTACQEALLAYQSWQLARANRAANVGPLLESARETFRTAVTSGPATAVALPAAIKASLDAGGYVDAGNDVLRVFLLFRILEDEKAARTERQEQRRAMSPPVPPIPTAAPAGSRRAVKAAPASRDGNADAGDYVAIPADDE